MLEQNKKNWDFRSSEKLRRLKLRVLGGFAIVALTVAAFRPRRTYFSNSYPPGGRRSPERKHSWVSCYDGASNHTGTIGEVGADNNFENSASRTCLYRNICLSQQAGGWVFYSRRPPKLGKFISRFSTEPDNNFESQGLPTVDIGMWRSLERWSPRYIPQDIPKNAIWSGAKVAAVLAPKYGTNFGHAMGDFIFPVYRMLEAFDINTQDIQIFAHVAAEDRYLGINFRNQAFSLLSSFKQLLWPGREIVFTPDDEIGDRVVRQLTSLPDSSRTDAVLCYERVLAGSVRMGFATEAGPAWNHYIRELVNRAGLSSYPEYSSNSMRVLVINKTGRRRIVNYGEVAKFIQSNITENVDVITSDRLHTMNLIDQMKLSRMYDLILTPCGGVSFLTAFMRDDSATIILSYRLKGGAIPSRMENNVWRFVSNRLVLHYPVLSEEELQAPPGHNGSKDSYYYRRDVANVVMDYSRLGELVEYALEYIRVRRKEESEHQ